MKGVRENKSFMFKQQNTIKKLDAEIRTVTFAKYN